MYQTQEYKLRTRSIKLVRVGRNGSFRTRHLDFVCEKQSPKIDET